MLLLGTLSFIQITFLPGILILKAFKIKPGAIQTLTFSFGLSLISNHLIVLAITAVGINISYTYYTIFAIELILFFKLYASTLEPSLGNIASNITTNLSNYIDSLYPPKTTNNVIVQSPCPHPNPLPGGEGITSSPIGPVVGSERLPGNDQILSKTITRFIAVLFSILAAASIWWAFKVWYTNADTIFTQWDAIISWNHWATEWFSGSFPNATRRYAQLIPTNFAVSYAFLESTQIQFFAKGFMPIFNLFILLLMFDLGLETKNVGYFIGVVATRFIIKEFLGSYISSGYVDVALAFFSFLPIYTLLKAQTASSQEQRINYIQLGAIFAAGAALTKQNGLFIFAIYPVLAYLLVLKNSSKSNRKTQLLHLLKSFSISLLIILPWYIFNEYRIFTGANDTNVLFLMGSRHEGRALLERLTRAAGLLGKYVFLYPFVLILLPFLNSTFQWTALFVLLPYTFIWAAAFSTFPRNLSIALPLLGMIVGMSAEKLISFGEQLIHALKFERIKLIIVILAITAIIVIGGFLVPDDVLINHQTEQQKDILLSFINVRIYDYFKRTGGYEPIMTNYPIQYLPGLEDMQIPIGNFSDYDYYQEIKNQHPEARLMLVFRGRAANEILEEISQNIDSGAYKLIFEKQNYMFVEIKE
ncbi:MAG: hypothetical protein U9Q82_13875 [Chloroflexota bacterium]|nr:hypothetical protein [Chloroflexota bacterium]